MPDVKHTGRLKPIADLAGVAWTTLREWGRKGKVKVYKDAAGEERYHLDEVRKYLEANPPTVGRPKKG